jgi:hypothetical protein
MQNTIGNKLVQIAALRVEALRRLIALAPPEEPCELIHSQLAEAEALLKYRLAKFADPGTDPPMDDPGPKLHARS